MATEEEKILSIKVDYAEAIEKIADYKSKIDEIKKAEARYKKEVKEGTMTQQEYNERITAAKVKTDEYKTAIKVLEKQVTSQIKTQKSNADIMKEVNGLLGVNAKSIAEAQAANKALREAVRNLSDEEEGSYKMRQKLNAQIDENTRYIQRNSDEYVKQKMTIGDYKEQVKLAMVELKNGGLTMNSVGIVAKGFADILSKGMRQGFSDATHSATKFVGVCRLVGTALIAIPIFAVVAALAALAASFTRTQKGMEFFQVTTAKVGAAIDVLLDRIALTADAFKSLMNFDFTSFGNKFKNAFAGMGEEMKNEWSIAGKLKESLIEIEKEETMLGMKRAANRAEIEKLKMVSDDVTKSTKERQEAAKKAFDMERDLMDEEIQLQERRIANQLGFVEVSDEVRQTMKEIATGAMSADEAISKLGISSSTINDLQEFSEDVKELYDKSESSTTRQIKLQNKLNSISKEGREKQLAITEKELEAIRQMEDALVGIIKANKEIERNKVAEAYDKEIEALKAKLNTEKALTEGSQKEILSLIEETEKKKRELMEGFSFDTEVYEEQRRTLAKSYDGEIVLLKNKLSTERGLTEEAQNQILKIIKAKEKEKSEAVAKVSIVDADLEEERQRTILVYDREIEDLKKRLETEKDLTEKAREAILEIIKAKEIQKENELDKLNDESLNREIERQQKQIQLQLDGVKEGTEEEHNLRVKALELQRESELSNKELTEQMKLAIVKKYEKLMNEEAIRYAEDTAQAQSDAIKLQFETAIAEAYGNEQEILRIQMEQKKAELDAIQQMEGESLEEFNLRRLTAENEYLSAKQDLADKEVEIEQSKLQAMSDVTGGLISLIEAIGEENKAMAVASKILALAQIAIDTGRAISSGVAEAIKAGPFPANLAAIATTVAAVMANIATAIKTVKSAKFATGGDVTGAGTGTSDSIPAMLSNGESVMTAKATSMFAPILSAFNQAGGGVPIYGQQAGSRAMGEDMLAKSFAKGLEKMPAPVVSVEEISTVTNRVKVIENINRI